MPKIIGIVPKGEKIDLSKPNLDDIYYIGNNYAKRIQEAGLIPISLAPVDGWVDERVLELCDGFIAQGGKNMLPYHYQVLHHAFTRRKKYLGICLGMQLIHRYYGMRKYLEEKGIIEDVPKQIFQTLRQEGPSAGYLERVEGHRAEKPLRGDEDSSKHDCDVVPGTLLHEILGREKFRSCTFHNWRVKDPHPDLKVNAWASDGSGTIEGIEYEDYILGVQSHPEIDDLLPEIFRFLAK